MASGRSAWPGRWAESAAERGGGSGCWRPARTFQVKAGLPGGLRVEVAPPPLQGGGGLFVWGRRWGYGEGHLAGGSGRGTEASGDGGNPFRGLRSPGAGRTGVGKLRASAASLCSATLTPSACPAPSYLTAVPYSSWSASCSGRPPPAGGRGAGDTTQRPRPAPHGACGLGRCPKGRGFPFRGPGREPREMGSSGGPAWRPCCHRGSGERQPQAEAPCLLVLLLALGRLSRRFKCSYHFYPASRACVVIYSLRSFRVCVYVRPGEGGPLISPGFPRRRQTSGQSEQPAAPVGRALC